MLYAGKRGMLVFVTIGMLQDLTAWM